MTTNRHPEYKLEDYTKDNPELAKEVEKEMKRMTNYEKIKNMTVDEMAELLNNKDCDQCAYKGDECGYDCLIGVKEWLQSESEE